MKIKRGLVGIIGFTVSILSMQTLLYAMNTSSEEISDEVIEQSITTYSEPTTFGDFTYEENESTVMITGYKGKEKNIIIPNSINGKAVTIIGENAFWGHDNLESVEIPSSVISIENHAFYYCISLVNVKMPEQIENIGDYAFAYCRKLSNFTIPSHVKYIGQDAFSTCKSLRCIEIPSGVKCIGFRTFEECKIII